MNNHGYFSIGIYHGKHEVNQDTLWRSAYAFGASFVFTIGQRFSRQASDTGKAYCNIPMFNFSTIDDLIEHLPYSCPLVGVELDEEAISLDRFVHPIRATYLLGAEDHGLPEKVRQRCHCLVQIDNLAMCLNVSTVGSLVLYDRMTQRAGTKALNRGKSVVSLYAPY